MSTEGHEHAAAGAEAAARRHSAHFDPSASAASTRCAKAQADPGFPCWTVDVNSTEEHLAHAEQLRKMAADHRAASQALRDAEVSACAGLAEADRDTSPFQRPGDIAGVEEVYSAGSAKIAKPAQLAGAAVTVRAVPGLTKEYLQRLVSCHVARNASMGHSMPEMATCPLGVKGATATVESANAGFRIEVRGEDPGAAAEILRRSRVLVAGPAPK